MKGKEALECPKKQTPRLSRGALFYKTKHSTFRKFVKKNLEFCERFFYSILFNHMETAEIGIAETADFT